MTSDAFEFADHERPVPLHVLERDTVVDLPRPLNSLIGREAQLRIVIERLRSPMVRLLTLTGPGGIGKSRLAIAAGHALVDSFECLHFVPLATITDPAQVAEAIARRLGVRESAGMPIEVTLRDHLRRRPTLLILDNLEQILGATGTIVELLSQCHELTILATSRVTLRVSGEYEVTLPSMELPDPDAIGDADAIDRYESVALFAERVRAFQPDFRLDARNTAAVAEICQRLDGLPLAIELAAARMKILTPVALLARLTSRLDLLTGGGRDVLPHQQTMRNTIAWSYDLLSPEEQRLFRRISVFSGWFDFNAAAAIEDDAPPVFDDGVSTLSRYFDTIDKVLLLVEHSLLRRLADSNGEPRFGMLATIREFGLEQLDRSSEGQAIRDRHAAYMLSFATFASRQLTGGEQVAWMERIEHEHANAQAALTWLESTGQGEQFIRLACAFRRFWFIRGHFEIGRTWLERAARLAVDQVSLPTGLRAEALHDAGTLAIGQGKLTEARTHALASLELARTLDDRRPLAQATGLLSMISYRETDYETGLHLVNEALGYSRQANDSEGIAWALHTIGTIALDTDDLEGSRGMLVEARAAYEAAGNMHGAAQSIDNLSVAFYCLGEYEEAESLAQEVLDVFRRVGDLRRTAIALDHVGKCARRRGKYRQSWTCHRESLGLRREYGDPRGLAVWMEAAAALLSRTGHHSQAALTIGSAAALRDSIACPVHGNELIDLRRIETDICNALGEAEFRERVRAGRVIPFEQAIDDAVSAMTRTWDPESDADSMAPIPFDLTPRELDVLRLLVRHARDQEIADTLFISPRTVARHLAGIFRKLGVHSRRDAAAKAIEFGLHQANRNQADVAGTAPASS
jgi:predicted ATPase/DNA-binding CsgD family transcriptional regulator